MPRSIPFVQASVATGADSSNTAGYIIMSALIPVTAPEGQKGAFHIKLVVAIKTRLHPYAVW